jgi:hypothetical protein
MTSEAIAQACYGFLAVWIAAVLLHGLWRASRGGGAEQPPAPAIPSSSHH